MCPGIDVGLAPHLRHPETVDDVVDTRLAEPAGERRRGPRWRSEALVGEIELPPPLVARHQHELRPRSGSARCWVVRTVRMKRTTMITAGISVQTISILRLPRVWDASASGRLR